MAIKNIADMEALIRDIDAERDTKAAPKKSCFVIAPIGEIGTEPRSRSDKVLRHIIKPAADECGYAATRADEIAQPGLITTQVIERILNDPLVIADLTERNANVFYELALRHAIRKPFIQLIRAGDQIPFDVAGLRTIQVDHTDLDSAATARDEIVGQIRAIELNPTAIVTPISVAIDIQNLSQSGTPEDRSIAAIMTSIGELKTAIDQLTRTTVSPGRHVDLDALADSSGLDPVTRGDLATLPPDLRAAFVLGEVRNLPLNSIAEIMGLPVDVVAAKLLRARMKLAKMRVRNRHQDTESAESGT